MCAHCERVHARREPALVTTVITGGATICTFRLRCSCRPCQSHSDLRTPAFTPSELEVLVDFDSSLWHCQSQFDLRTPVLDNAAFSLVNANYDFNLVKSSCLRTPVLRWCMSPLRFYCLSDSFVTCRTSNRLSMHVHLDVTIQFALEHGAQVRCHHVPAGTCVPPAW